MSRDKFLPVIYGTMVFVLSACATAANGGVKEEEVRGIAKYEGDPRLGEEVKRACFVSSIDSFSENTSDTVVLKLSPKKSYVVEVYRSCHNLNQAQSIAVDAANGCVSKGDSLIVSESVFGLDRTGIGPTRCMIKKIHEWDPKAEDEEGEAETSEESTES